MQGAEAVALGVFNDHDTGVGHVHAHLDDGGGDQGIQFSFFEILHHGGFFLGFELAVHQSDPAVWQQRFGDLLIIALYSLECSIRAVLNGGAHQIDLTPAADLCVQKMIQIRPFFAGNGPGLDRGAAGGQFVQQGDVQVPVDQKPQSPGDGGGAHHQQVGVDRLFGQHTPLPHAKAVLFVNDSQAQAGKFHSAPQDGMGADHTVRLVVPDGSQGGAPGGGLHAAGQKRHPHPKGSQHPVQAFGVLCGQDLGGGQQSGLVSAADAGPDGGSSHQGLAAAHIPWQQAVHGMLPAHIR